MKRKITCLLVVIMVGLLTTITVFAENIVIGKTAEATSNSSEFDIIFSLPTKQDEIQAVVDVVIVLDKSSLGGSSNPLKTEAQNFIATLWEKSQTDNITFKIGLIRFNANVQTFEEDLLVLTADNYSKMQDFLAGYDGSGTNFHGALLQAKKWLDNDNTISDQHKFLVVISDFAGYFVDAGDGLGLGRYAIRHQDVTVPSTGLPGNPVYESNAEYNDKTKWGQYPALSDLQGTNPSFKYTTAMIEDLISGNKLLTGVAPVNIDDLKTVGTNYGEHSYSEYGTNYSKFTSEQISSMPSQLDNRQSDFPTMFEKSMYLCGNLFKQMKGSGYNVFGITKNYNMNIVLGYQNKAFVEWFEEKIGPRFDVTGGASDEVAKEIFSQVTSTIVELLGKGTITDVIADEFDYINERFAVKLDGIELPITAISEYEYGFGNELAPTGSGIYEYKLTYNPSTKTVKWDLNVSASKFRNLQLIFKVSYNGDVCALDKPIQVKTNKSAQLEYVNSIDHEAGLSYNKKIVMDSPTVTISSKDADCTKPVPPNTGINSNFAAWFGLLAIASIVAGKEIINKQKKK